MTTLINKIESREAMVAVLGLGYIGLPLAIGFAEAGFQVIGIDLDRSKVDKINAGISYITEVPSEQLANVVLAAQERKSQRLYATQDYDMIAEVDIVVVCVPTPLGISREPDISMIVQAVDGITKGFHNDMLVILESTTYPGTTEDVVLPKLEGASKSKQLVGQDFFLAFSPERIDPGRTDWTISNTPKLVAGVTADCTKAAVSLYSTIVSEIVPVSSPKIAEMSKLLENTFRSTNIALVNEVAIMCDRLNINVWEVIEAANTKPFGFMPFYPGPGLGGHCLPIDPQYLAWKLSTLDYEARFIKLAAEINFGMPEYVVNKITNALKEDGKEVNGSKVLVLGVTYKPNVDDVRESPAIDIIQILMEKKAKVVYHDPYVPLLEISELEIASVVLNHKALLNADCVVIVTDHSSYDWHWIVNNTKLVMDTRNATRSILNCSARVVKI